MASSGQITVSTAGTEVQGPSQPCHAVLIRAMPTNSGTVYVGNDGSAAVSSSTGFPLAATDPPIYVEVENLNQLWFDAATNGDKFAWILIEV